MKLSKITEVIDFLQVVDSCKGNIFLTSHYGDKINLKSKLSQYIAVAALLNSDNELELWCDIKEDEYKLLAFLNKNPNIVKG